MSFRKRGEILNDRGSGLRGPLLRGPPRTSSTPLRTANRRAPGNVPLSDTTARLKKLNIADESKTKMGHDEAIVQSDLTDDEYEAIAFNNETVEEKPVIRR